MNKQQITELINSKIIDNDNGQITAEVMRNVLNAINDYEEPIADELGRGNNAISQNAVTNEFTKVDEEINTLENNIKTLSSNVNAQVKELSDNVDGKVKEVDEKIEAGLQDVDSSIEDALQQVQNSLNSYLPYTGGTMNGNINMNGKRIDNAGIEEVTALPSVDLYEGRMVRWKNTTYTFYNGLWLALSDDLRGHVGETHSEEFLYQPTASDLSVKDGYAKIKRIKGKALVWNSLAKQNGSSIDSSGLTIKLANYKVSIKGTLSVTNWATVGVQSGVGLKAGHKYLYGVSKQIPAGYYLAIHDNAGGLSNSRTKTARIYEAQGDSTYSLYIVGSQNEQAVGTVYDYESYIKLFDLTQMFGEGNEPATVEEFEAMFPEPYYEYNAGALLSHDSTGIKSVGFNQWDEEWEIGTISNYGNNISSTVQIRSRNYISIIAGAEYFLSSHLRPTITFRVFFYDNNKTFISNTNVTGSRFTVPSNAAYMRLTTATGAYGTTYNNDICINLSHSGYRNGEYEPYMEYVAKWADGKKISELTSNGVVVFPHGLMSAGDVYDEITKDSAGKSIAIKRCEADTVNLTTTAFDTPVTYVLDDDLNLSYKVWDFGTEEILTDGFTNFFKADIEYGFNAVDMIRNNYYEIKSLKDRLNEITSALANLTSAQSAANDE